MINQTSVQHDASCTAARRTVCFGVSGMVTRVMTHLGLITAVLWCGGLVLRTQARFAIAIAKARGALAHDVGVTSLFEVVVDAPAGK